MRDLDDAAIEAFLRQLLLRVELVDTDDVDVEAIKDSTDTPILASLIASAAEALVTGDNGLLALKQKYPIVTPAEFASRLS